MINKNYSKTKTICRATFKYDNHVQAKTAALVGDFNGWSAQRTPMKRLKNGSFSVTISLPAGHSYEFRYVLDGATWENDANADGYVPNQYGGDNSVVTV